MGTVPSESEYASLHDAVITVLNREGVRPDIAIALLLNLAARACAMCCTHEGDDALETAQKVLKACFEHHRMDIAQRVDRGELVPAISSALSV